jgi:hypothetical protein
MKTTLNVDDSVFRLLKERAARENTTISALVETALRRFLEADRQPVQLRPLPTFDGGALKIDINSRREVYDALDAERDAELYGSVRRR